MWYGRLVLGDDTGGFYNARVANEISFTRPTRAAGERTFMAQWRCEPYRYLNPEATDIVMTESGVILNPGTATAKPLIKVEGSSDITLLVGTDAVLISELAGEITLDTEAMTAYDGDTLLSGLVTLPGNRWPRLRPGNTAVSWTGTVTKVTITPKWRD